MGVGIHGPKIGGGYVLTWRTNLYVKHMYMYMFWALTRYTAICDTTVPV